MLWPNKQFEAGVRKYMKEAGIEEEEFFELVLDETEAAVRKAAAALDLGTIKEAQVRSAEDATELDLAILKMAQTEENFQKEAVIRQESCTDSDGNEGNWVLYDSDGEKQLGCHSSKADAKKQERAIQARKHAEG